MTSIPESVAFFKSEKWRKLRSHYLTMNFATGIGWKIVRLVILFGLCYLILYPFFIKIINAFKGPADFYDPTVRFVPKTFTTNNILTVLTDTGFLNALKNTAFVSITTAVLQTVVSSLIGYGFARFKFKLNGLLFSMVILSLVVPPSTIIIPLYLRFRSFLGIFELLGTPFPLFILSVTGFGIKNALYIYMFRQFFRNSPKELEEAAYIDGCGTFKTYSKIMLPSATSVFITVLMLSLAWQWTDMIYSSMFLLNWDYLARFLQTVTFSTDAMVGSNMLSIATVAAVLPIALVYIFFQRHLIQSISSSGLVG
ncbi:MAG: carbohydrate ABC transporter permease [Oscillospiraceae bacterium]|jgi:multiple sugar transport system permease protein|nr:carbohydrate ABC transporter permease [Oscillospiraceae bacterium]